jgi:hypothetical protein
MELYTRRHPQFITYSENGIVTVDLDRAFLHSSNNVHVHGHGVAKELSLGSETQTIQTVLPNPLLIVGPSCLV